MAKRYFNWKLAIVLLISVVVLGITAYGLRQWQRGHRAEQGLEAGIEAYEQQKWEEAANNLGRYLGINQNDVPILLKYADAQLNRRPVRSDNIQQAIAAYRAVLRADGRNSEATMRLAEIYLGIGSPGEAELIARRQLEGDSVSQEERVVETQTKKDPGLRRMLALALASQRRFDEAATELKAIIKEHPQNNILAYETLGQLTEQRPQDFIEPSVYWFDQAVKENPSSALAYLIRAGFHLRSKDRPKALADLEQAQKQDLSDPIVRLRLANEFIKANVLDKAEDHLEAVQQAAPTEQMLWQIWAELAQKSQSQEMMLKTAENGLKELASQPWDFMPLAAELFIRCGQLDRAADCISRLEEKDIVPAVVVFLEGLIADRKGHTYEAIRCWNNAIGLGGKSPQIRLALASAYSRLGDTQSALRQLRTLVSDRPDFFNGRLALAKLLAQTGYWAEATEYAVAALQLSPENVEAALVQLQARMQLLAVRSTDENTQVWQDVEKQLAALEKATDGADEVKLLQFQLAMQQRNFSNANALLTQLKKSRLLKVRIAIAEADLLVAEEKEKQAISLLEQVIEEFPLAVEPIKYLAILSARQGDHERCQVVLKDALERIEQPIAQRELGLLLAQVYTQEADLENAYRILDAISLKLPNDIPVKCRLLACEQVIENPERAQKLVDDIKSLEGEDSWRWRYEQARVWFTMEDFKKHYPRIIPLLQKNLLANPDDQSSRILLATSYERAGELQLAISTYRDALSRSPDDLRVIIPTVAALYRAQEYDQAEQILNRASQEQLYHPELQKLQLQSHLRRGQLSLASDILENLIGSDPNNQAACLSLALLKMRQDKFTEAAVLLDKLKAQDPNSLPATSAQIQLNIRQNKPQEALILCDEIVKNLDNASAYILRARTLASLSQIDKATKDFEHATTIEPDNVEVWVARSDFYHSMGRPVEAIADIQQALSLAHDDTRVQSRAISLLLASDDFDNIQQGRVILEKSLESSPDNIELRLLKARLMLAEATAPAVESAKQILQKITEDQPKVVEAWALLGQISLIQGQSGRAIDTALRGLVHRPNDRGLLLLKARAEAARSPVLAIPTFKVLRELDSNDVDTAVLLADTYIATGEPEKAVNLLREQLNTCDVSTRRRCNIALAVALYKNGDKEEAQKKFDSLLQSEPDSPSPLLAQAKLFEDDKLWKQLGQKVSDWYQQHPEDTQVPLTIAGNLIAIDDPKAKSAAEDMLRMILNKDSKCTEAMAVLAMLLQTTDRFSESAVLYQGLLEIEPDNPIVINNLAWIMCEEQGKYRQALELAQRGLKIAPQYVDLIDTHGVIHYRLGEFDKAVQDFTECIKLYPSTAPQSVASRFHLARAFAKLGQTQKAIEQLNQTLDLESKIGSLSMADLAETHRLLEKLTKGG